MCLRFEQRIDHGFDLSQRGKWANLHTRQFAIRSDNISFGHPPDAEGLRGTCPQVRAVGIGDVKLLKISLGFWLCVNIIYPEENHIAARLVISPGSFEIGSFFLPKFSPRSPEVDQDNLAFYISEPKLFSL